MNKMYLVFFYMLDSPYLFSLHSSLLFQIFLKFQNGLHQHIFSNKLFHFFNNKILDRSLVLFLGRRNWSNTRYNARFEVHQM